VQHLNEELLKSLNSLRGVLVMSHRLFTASLLQNYLVAFLQAAGDFCD
jgi:hypothetical protein